MGRGALRLMEEGLGEGPGAGTTGGRYKTHTLPQNSRKFQDKTSS